jgi:hypothetical protein
VLISRLPWPAVFPAHPHLITKKFGMAAKRHDEPLPICPSLPILQIANQLCQSMSLVQKKKVMTGLRVGVVPKYSRRQKVKEPTWKQHSDIVRLLDAHKNPKQDISMHDVWYLLAPFLATPVRRSILSVALRCSNLLWLLECNL